MKVLVTGYLPLLECASNIRMIVRFSRIAFCSLRGAQERTPYGT